MFSGYLGLPGMALSERPVRREKAQEGLNNALYDRPTDAGSSLVKQGTVSEQLSGESLSRPAAILYRPRAILGRPGGL